MFFKKKPILDSYLQELAKQQVFVVSLNKNTEFDDNDGSAEAMKNYLDRNARETSNNTTFHLLTLKQQDKTVYPFFTDEKRSGIWIKKKPIPFTGFAAITQLEMSATNLFIKFKGAPSSIVLVINPLSEDERHLTHQELQALAQL